MERIRIRIGLHADFVADFHVRQIALVDIRQYPYGTHIRNDERLGHAGLQQLPGSHVAFHDFAANRRVQWNFRRGRFFQVFRLRNSQNFQSEQRGVQIGLRLDAVRFGLQQIAFGDGVVVVQILRAIVVLVCDAERITRFQVGGEQQRIVRAAHFQQRLALLHSLSRHRQQPAYRATDLRDHRRGLEGVVGDGAGEPQHARQIRSVSTVTTCTCDVWSAGIENSPGFVLGCLRRIRSHLARALLRAACRQSQRRQRDDSQMRCSAISPREFAPYFHHGRLLVPTASRSCSTAVK